MVYHLAFTEFPFEVLIFVHKYLLVALSYYCTVARDGGPYLQKKANPRTLKHACLRPISKNFRAYILATLITFFSLSSTFLNFILPFGLPINPSIPFIAISFRGCSVNVLLTFQYIVQAFYPDSCCPNCCVKAQIINYPKLKLFA